MARRAAYRKKRQNRFGMLLVSMVIEQIEAETKRSEEIDQYEKYTQTMKYIEDVAKDRLGLVYEGEIIFKDENN